MAPIITQMRRLCVLVLVCYVAYGTAMYDQRFTILLLPPFLMYWLDDLKEEDLDSIWMLRLLRRMGKWQWRAFLMGAGLAAGYGLSKAI